MQHDRYSYSRQRSTTPKLMKIHGKFNVFDELRTGFTICLVIRSFASSGHIQTSCHKTSTQPFQAARNQVFHHSNVVHIWGCIATASLPWKRVRFSDPVQSNRWDSYLPTFKRPSKIGNLRIDVIKKLHPKYIQLLLLKTSTQRLKIKTINTATLLTLSHNSLSFHCPLAEQANDVHCCQATLTCACLADSMHQGVTFLQVGNTSFWSMCSGCERMSLASICSVQLDIRLAHLEPVVSWVSLVSGTWETRDHLSACFKRGRSTAGMAYEVLDDP